MSDHISNVDFIEVMQECFQRDQSVVFTPSGVSMLPMLGAEDDYVTLSPKPNRLKKYDVALYVRPKTQQLVLHRMIGFTKAGDYIFSGDNQYYYEYGIGEEDVLALMTAFRHNGKDILPNDLAYRRYIRRMMLKKRFHMLLRKGYRRIFKNRK